MREKKKKKSDRQNLTIFGQEVSASCFQEMDQPRTSQDLSLSVRKGEIISTLGSRCEVRENSKL